MGSWQVAVMWVDETPAGDASGRKCPHAEQNRQQPIDEFEVVSAGGSPLTGAPMAPMAPLAHARRRL